MRWPISSKRRIYHLRRFRGWLSSPGFESRLAAKVSHRGTPRGILKPEYKMARKSPRHFFRLKIRAERGFSTPSTMKLSWPKTAQRFLDRLERLVGRR
jgi:hypothetical protein